MGKKKDKRDHTAINMDEPYEVNYWAGKFNITVEELSNAANVAESSEIKKIERMLNQYKIKIMENKGKNSGTNEREVAKSQRQSPNPDAINNADSGTSENALGSGSAATNNDDAEGKTDTNDDENT